MKKTIDSEIRRFELIPIGKVEVNQNRRYVGLFPDYKPALNYLELFSHAIIFIKNDRGYERNDSNITGTVGCSNSGIMDLITVKLLSVDKKKGVVEVDCSMVKDGTVVFDIKPYFPCEDRVKASITPNFMSGWPEWRQERSLAKIVTPVEDINDESYSALSNVCNINQIGVIRKIDGEFYLKLNTLNTYLINHLKGFSHVKVLWWFDKFDKSTYRKVTECNPPYENAPRTGIFATRSPVRPNPIALTTVRVLSSDTENGLFKISQIDSFDKTPIIDIIPYIPANDRIKDYYVPEWLKHWPEWLDDREYNSGLEDLETIDSDIIRIKKYMSSNLAEQLTGENFFEEVSQAEYKFSDDITVIGARQNNLKGVSCNIPKNKMTVITGVSGSGKSSLAFDTIYAESQRRFMDSMSATGRTLFGQMEKPDFDQITGLPPAVAIEQKTVGRNPRSTVGTRTDLYDYLRLLFSKIGTRHCPECGRAVVALKTDEIVNILERLKPKTFFSIQAFNSEEVVGEFVALDDNEINDDFNKHLKECVAKALTDGNGAIEVFVNKTDVFLFQTKEMCYHCNRVFFALTTSTFSFNNPESMCPVCKGLGVKLEVEPDLIVSNPDLSILDEASGWWGNLRKHRQKSNANWMKGEILALAKEMNVDLELPWKALPEDFRRQALYGSDGKEVRFTYENTNGRKGEIVRPVEGAYNSITRLFRENSGDTANRIAASFMKESRCSGCHGERLSAEGRLVSIAGTRFPEVVIMTIEALKNWVISLSQTLSEEELQICVQILKDLVRRLENLIDVGVSYLTLDRSVPTLSGGEAQRLRLATQLGSGITNILYVLDEPSIGLHPKDHGKLIRIMQRLRDEGNTVIAVEHDVDTMLAADKIIDIGPGAGVHGGLIIAEGSPEEIMQNQQSETGRYLKSYKNIELGSGVYRKEACDWIKVIGARHNNLKNIDVSIPLGVLTCITGVSGSGKSSLIFKTLYPALGRLLNKSDDLLGQYDSIEGMETIDQIISISQQSIGRTPRSNPATYTGIFEDIRNLFASLDESKNKGYKQNKFSFNSKEGQCEACGGEGRKCVQMHFLPDVWVECSVCHGRRFNPEALEINYNGKTIADVLDMNVEEALNFFISSKKISKVLQTLYDVGLGYIKLGQSALTLSGGEAQRIKLAKELSRENKGRTIYLLDEPTTGLHFADVQNLLMILHRITQDGNTVLVIEHNLEVITNADWIIDLGPEGGNAGGYVIAQGPPEEVAKIRESYTGQSLKEFYKS